MRTALWHARRSSTTLGLSSVVVQAAAPVDRFASGVGRPSERGDLEDAYNRQMDYQDAVDALYARMPTRMGPSLDRIRPAGRAARPSRADRPGRAPDRDQRQDQHGADGGVAAGRLRGGGRDLHQPPPPGRAGAGGAGHPAHLHRGVRRDLGLPGAVPGRGRPGLRPAGDLLRGPDHPGLHLVRRAAGGRPGDRGRHGRHLGRHQPGRRRGGDRHPGRPRPPRAGRHPGRGGRREGRHHQARRHRGQPGPGRRRPRRPGRQGRRAGRPPAGGGARLRGGAAPAGHRRPAPGPAHPGRRRHRRPGPAARPPPGRQRRRGPGRGRGVPGSARGRLGAGDRHPPPRPGAGWTPTPSGPGSPR